MFVKEKLFSEIHLILKVYKVKLLNRKKILIYKESLYLNLFISKE